MTVLYPHERVKEVLQPLSLATAHRIVLKPYLSDPLAARRSKSRFCDGRTYAVLYAAGDFATAFAEVVVRDRLVQRDRRFVPMMRTCKLTTTNAKRGARHSQRRTADE